ncbi:hypothetical protein GY21_14030 [Cryobacterium roopkundense]|uniref:BIG2 domain-containing protein n=1 Tax=Cryobacterium roopkundense TaxID=1001240 RepID=A0A099J570_9MICO|nr:Ig-like domain-containing protein [Cryobacterium roopkundense]KGJ72627.1 hypothetical protein GY21_14030 [Cryobacterium roopkundense]MBB5641935.1 hypothetical protein [Cryobacterium roopkundense]
MNTHLRRRLLADAAVNSHANPAHVDRALQYGNSRYRRRVASVYAVTLTVSAILMLALVAVHPAAYAVLNSLGADSTTTAPLPTATNLSDTPNSNIVLASISIVPGAVTLAAGETAQLSVVGNFSDGASGPVSGVATWQSDNDTIAIITTEGVVTALVPDQNATITASLGGFTDTTTVIVAAKVLTRISIRSVQSSYNSFQKDLETDSQAGLPVGGEAALVADGAYSDGTSGALAGVTWASDETGIATIGADGTLRAVAAGTAQVTASLQGVVGTVTIDVSEANVVD